MSLSSKWGERSDFGLKWLLKAVRGVSLPAPLAPSRAPGLSRVSRPGLAREASEPLGQPKARHRHPPVLHRSAAGGNLIARQLPYFLRCPILACLHGETG